MLGEFDWPTGNICSDENLSTPAFEFGKSTQSLTLAHIPMNRYSSKAKDAEQDRKPKIAVKLEPL